MNVLNGIGCKLNWIEIKFNSTVGLKLNWNFKKIEYKLVKKVLKIYSWMWYWEKINFKKHRFKNAPFMPRYLGTN
jgi:hypothetical protein